mgnify:CR=1 FL=1
MLHCSRVRQCSLHYLQSLRTKASLPLQPRCELHLPVELEELFDYGDDGIPALLEYNTHKLLCCHH